jgi:hypothetical protein
MEFVIRLMFHNSSSPVGLTGFKFNDRSTSSMRNKIISLQKKYNIESPGQAPGEDDADTPKPKKTRQPKKAKTVTPKKRKVEEPAENAEEGGQEETFEGANDEQANKEVEVRDEESV